jgi:hypothetical protein
MKRVVFLFLIMMMITACNPGVETQAVMTTASPSPAIAHPTQVGTSTETPAIQPTLTPAPTQTAPNAPPIFNLYIDNLAVSPQGALYASGFNQGDDLRHFAQWEGNQWSELGRGFSTAGNSLAVDTAGNLYTEILTGTVSCMAIMQWDGSAWVDITGNFTSVVDALKPGRDSCNIPVVALSVDAEDNLYATGSYYYLNADNTSELPMGFVAVWNHQTWAAAGQGFDGVNIHALSASPNGKVYVSGEQPATPESGNPIDAFIAQWDGEKWAQIGTQALNSCLSITHLAMDQGGDVYTSCTLNGPGELILRWDGTDWTTIADRLEGEAPVVFVMSAGENGQLFIGGDFESVDGVPAKDIAFWDGSAWHALGEGVNERVQALALDPSGVLYVGGWFSEAGGEPVDHIAIWDGEAWQALPP